MKMMGRNNFYYHNPRVCVASEAIVCQPGTHQKSSASAQLDEPRFHQLLGIESICITVLCVCTFVFFVFSGGLMHYYCGIVGGDRRLLRVVGPFDVLQGQMDNEKPGAPINR
jgi:hypothetical protein